MKRVNLHLNIGVALGLLVSSSQLRAATPLDDAKTLYADASFEEALAALGRLDKVQGGAPDALEYKALCLIALGRSTDAQTVTEELITASPTFVPGDADITPRFTKLLNDTRRKLLPGIARQQFAAGREQFRSKNADAALKQFGEVLKLASDPVWKDSSEATDLRTLSEGFLDLVSGAAASAKAPAPETALSGSEAPQYVAAVPINQVLPRWFPPPATTAKLEYHGTLRLVIGKDGHVVDASMQRATFPAYDALVLAAARTWIYEPATMNGAPIQSVKLLDVQLKAN